MGLGGRGSYIYRKELVLAARLRGKVYDRTGRILSLAGKLVDHAPLTTVADSILYTGADQPGPGSKSYPTQSAQIIDALSIQAVGRRFTTVS